MKMTNTRSNRFMIYWGNERCSAKQRMQQVMGYSGKETISNEMVDRRGESEGAYKVLIYSERPIGMTKTVKGKVQLSLEEPKAILFQQIAMEKGRQLGNKYIVMKVVYKYLRSLGYSKKYIEQFLNSIYGDIIEHD